MNPEKAFFCFLCEMDSRDPWYEVDNMAHFHAEVDLHLQDHGIDVQSENGRWSRDDTKHTVNVATRSW